MSLSFSEIGRITISLLFLPAPEIKWLVAVYSFVFVRIYVIRGNACLLHV